MEPEEEHEEPTAEQEQPTEPEREVSEPEKTEEERQREKVLLPSQQGPEGWDPYATYRDAPGGPEGETEVSSGDQERTYSTGFILGVAIIVLSLIAGVAILRLYSRVGDLEQRVNTLEQQLSPDQAASPSS